PPKKKPEVALAEKLVAVLEARHDAGEADPLPLGHLAELAAPGADPKLLKRALGKDHFRNRAVVALKADPDSPVALAADAEQLAAGPLLLQRLLRASRTETNHAVPLDALKKKVVPALQRPFAQAVGRQIESASLPATAGCILHKGKQLLFLTED